MQLSDRLKYQSKNPIRRFFIRRFQKKLLALIRHTQAKQVLDAGCGEGYLLDFLTSQIRDWDLEAFDISEELISRARQRVPAAILSVRDIYNSGYPDEVFDLVLGTEVLEHLQYPERALSEIRRLSRNWVILSVPNEPLFSISNLLSGRNILTLGSQKDHLHKWPAKDFINLVNKYFKASRIVKSFPWTIVLAEKRQK